jgi:hypothetical protein
MLLGAKKLIRDGVIDDDGEYSLWLLQVMGRTLRAHGADFVLELELPMAKAGK